MKTDGPADQDTTSFEPTDVGALREQIRSGAAPKFVFFWGHTASDPEAVGKECFSQWYPAEFTVDGVRYPTAEHFMMAEKARLFGDEEGVRRVLAASNPGAAKQAGRQVKGFDEARWQERRFDIVVAGNRAKFGQHPALRDYLIGTRRRVLVEASPADAVWGIGLAADDPRAADPLRWRGLNLLGFALMVVRRELGG